MKNKLKKALLAIIILCICIIIGLLARIRCNAQTVEQTVTQASDEYNIAATETEINHTTRMFQGAWIDQTYTVNVTVQDEISKEEIYQFLSEVEADEEALSRWPSKVCIGARVRVGSYEYTISPDEQDWLLKNGKKTYIYRTNYETKAEKEKEEERRNASEADYPYVGMNEEYIGYTKLGYPNEVEKSLNYNAKKDSHRFKVYRWYNSQGDLIATAQAGQGRVYNVWHSDDKKGYLAK